MARAIVDPEVCKGCSLCVRACPKGIMKIDDKSLNKKGYHPAKCIDEKECIGCAFCALTCPDIAITVER